jgi:hypothetical protein
MVIGDRSFKPLPLPKNYLNISKTSLGWTIDIKSNILYVILMLQLGLI